MLCYRHFLSIKSTGSIQSGLLLLPECSNIVQKHYSKINNSEKVLVPSYLTVLPHADVVILVDQVLGTGGGGWPTGADIVEVVDSSSAGGAAQVVLEAALGAGSVLQRCHVLAVIVSDVDVPGPSGGCRVHIDVDAVACLAITVHDHCKQVDTVLFINL